MTKNFYKVQKQISKKRGKLDALHENSRDSKKLRRASAREDKLARLAAATSKARQSYGENAHLSSYSYGWSPAIQPTAILLIAPEWLTLL
jgi:translation machinery-associated protein 16